LPQAQIIAAANQKGGVGKTTTIINLGAGLDALNKNVLLIDLDPQHSLTKAMGIDPTNLEAGSFSLFRGGNPQMFRAGNLAVIPTRLELSAVNYELATKVSGNSVLKKALVNYSNEFDYILLDTPPNLDRLTLNALVAAHWLVIPCQCQYMALEGLSIFLDTFDEVKEVNRELEKLAVLPMAYNASRSHEKEALATLREKFGELCREPVPYRAEYLNATVEHRPVSGEQFDYWKSLAQYVMDKSGSKKEER